MKKFALFLAPLMAISFLTNCGNKTDPTPPGPKQYTVTFDTGEGGSAVPSQIVEENKCVNKPTDPTREGPDDTHGYIFNEWQLDGIAFDFNTQINKDINLKATWRIANKYTVAFNSADGSTIPPQKVLENHFAIKPINPTRGPSESTVFTFSGWKKDDGSKFDFEHTPITKNITLTANWVKTTREYDITFNPNGGKWSDGSTDPIVKKFKYGQTPVFEIPIKSSDDQYDYLFSNWSPKIEKVTGSSIKEYTANFVKTEKNATNLLVDFPSDANKTITFEYEGTLNNVDWGDGEISNGESSHTYRDAKQYIITIYGNLTSLSLAQGSVYSDGNKYVKNVKLNDGITSIGNYAFNNCSSLTSINIPISVTSIGECAFCRCYSLASINIPISVTSIGNYAFSECSSLTLVIISNKVISIGNFAFSECSSLTSIFIPSSVTSIGGSVFDSCSSLALIVVDPNNPNYDSRDNCNAIISKQNNTLLYGCMNTIIPNSVTAIESKAFSRHSSLTSINIPNSITSIGKYAFYYCSSLTSIFIPNSVTTMGTDVFTLCEGLTEIRCQCKESEKPSGWNKTWYGSVNPKIIKWDQPRFTDNSL